MRFLSFKPIYQERVWGGRGLATKLGRELDSEQPIGESWEIVDRPEAQSLIATGAHAGKSLREAIEAQSATLMGPNWSAAQPFPILVKWLDCQERLSLQVHPPASVAGELKGEPKTENWYIADAEAGASLIVGLKNGVTRDQFEAALKDDTLEDCVHRFPVKTGESMFVQSGRIHAIDGGNLILEIQQNSDTTYRVYDWGRIGLDGKPRQLHIEESLKSIDFEDFEPPMINLEGDEQLLADCEEFRLRKIKLSATGAPLSLPAGEEPRILSVVEGTLTERTDGSTLEAGSNVILPYSEAFAFTAQGKATVLITDRFTGKA